MKNEKYNGVRMKRTIVLFFALVAFGLGACYAGNGSGKITTILAHTKIVNNENIGVVMFNVETHLDPPAECPGHQWAFNADDGHGKAMYAMLLSAAAQGKTVVVKGAGDCQAWSDRERPLWIKIDY
jgi:hypothetical protein